MIVEVIFYGLLQFIAYSNEFTLRIGKSARYNGKVINQFKEEEHISLF